MLRGLHSSKARPLVRSGWAALMAHSPLSTPRIVDPADQADVSTCIETLSSAFEKVPCTNAFSDESGQSVQDYVSKTVRDSLRSHGALVEAGDMSAVALWELPYLRTKDLPPKRDNDPVAATTAPGPIKKEWKDVIANAKRKYIGLDRHSNTEARPMDDHPIRPHYHLDFVGRNPGVPKVEGAVSATIRPFLGRAEQDHLSVWLEATSMDVVSLYEYFGFRVVEEITVGVGRVDAEGKAKTGGPGVKAWLMLIENHQET